MTNIPTDLLRTLVAVVDLRSFTKAAASLGVTQPAVSSQIKRLQFLLAGDIFDRSSQGVTLTPHGELVVSYARRLLSINDQIVHIGAEPRSELVIRVGTSSDYVSSVLPASWRGSARGSPTSASSSAPTTTIRWCANCVAAISMSSSVCR
jgi:DNA-binding transcriptional LysR family regulator